MIGVIAAAEPAVAALAALAALFVAKMLWTGEAGVIVWAWITVAAAKEISNNRAIADRRVV